MQNKLSENKIAIVTGATGNLGKAVVGKFIDEDFFVIGTAIKEEDTSFPGEKYEQRIVDLQNEEATQKFVEAVVSKYNKIDAAILTAGGFAMGKIEETSAADISFQYKLNFETAYNVARPVFTQMLKQQMGRIFLIGSKPGLSAKNSKGMIAYGLSKALIFRLAELMNDEAKDKNVAVNVVVPSTINTPQNRAAMPGADAAKWVKPGAIADIIYWHCTEEAAALRETIIKVYNNA